MTEPTALHAVLDTDDPGDRIDIPTRMRLRRAGSDPTALAAALVEDALAWFRCDPTELVIDLADLRYSRLADGGDWLEVEGWATSVRDLKAAAAAEAVRTRIYSRAREDLAADEAWRKATGPRRHTIPEAL